MGIGHCKSERLKLGLITPSTALLFILLILAVSISYMFASSFIREFYIQRRFYIENVFSIHRAIVRVCNRGCGGTTFTVFIPSESKIVFESNQVKFTGVELRGYSPEYIELMLNRDDDVIVVKAALHEDKIVLSYFFRSNTRETQPLSFKGEVIPPGLFTVTIFCDKFVDVNVEVYPAG